MNTEKVYPIRVVIIEDNRFVRKGMEIMLQNEPDFELIGTFPNCEDAFNATGIGKADIVLMDNRLPGMSGIEGITYLRENYPRASVLICTAYEDDENVFKAIAAGAVGFVAKKVSPAQLLTALRNVAEGGSPMTPHVARRLLNFFRTVRQRPGEIKLSEFEHTVLVWLSRGESYNTVAAELSVSETAILRRIRKIYQKLNGSLNKI
ncbi:hypothetical protein B1H10_08400 [candidate division KSB1 bacterium 4484_188]|nr:MAG: hypothetical protein B1H10_08400 [candidate division KSB1 bacterium 4484_188]RKY57400.1 MAG: DNA-binding response regulator [Candidatus Neomarinimicrobiota bacterium]